MKRKLCRIMLHIGLAIICIVMALPFVLMISTSISAESVIMEQGYRFWPRRISFDAYAYLFDNFKKVANAYGVTAFFSLASVLLSVLLCCMLAYPLSRSIFKGKKIVCLLTYFAAVFGGGLVGSYLVNAKYLSLNDTIWIYILPGLLSPLYVFLLRCFFREVPEELIDSVVMDGGGEYRVFGSIFMPSVKPVAAVLGIFTFMQKWNDWFTSQMYISDERLESLQFFLYSITRKLETMRRMQEGGAGTMVPIKDLPVESIRMAMCTIVVFSTVVIFGLVRRVLLGKKFSEYTMQNGCRKK